MTPWKPKTKYLAVRPDRPQGHPSIPVFDTLGEARSYADYWETWIPQSPRYVIVRAVTTYEVLDAAE